MEKADLWFTEIQSYANEPRSKQMIELAIQIFSIVIEVLFPAVRFTVEPSLETEDSLFLAWTTRFPAGEFSEIPDKIVGVSLEAAAIYGLKVRPLL
jgi:hypothetical protein